MRMRSSPATTCFAIKRHLYCQFQAGCEWLLSLFVSDQHSAMASPDESAGPEECFSEAQLKAMAGVFQGLLDKAQAHRPS